MAHRGTPDELVKLTAQATVSGVENLLAVLQEYMEAKFQAVGNALENLGEGLAETQEALGTVKEAQKVKRLAARFNATKVPPDPSHLPYTRPGRGASTWRTGKCLKRPRGTGGRPGRARVPPWARRDPGPSRAGARTASSPPRTACAPVITTPGRAASAARPLGARLPSQT